jgi:hypothetical protein
MLVLRTFLLFHLRVSSWYFSMFCSACALASSAVSMVVLMSSLSGGPWVLTDCNFTSSGTMVSSPYRSLKGENFVVLDSVVLCDQMTLGNSSVHFPLGMSVMFFFIPVKIIPLARSTAPFDCGWYTKAKHNLVPSWEQNLRNSAQSNCLPLSTVSSYGTLNLQTIFCQKKLCMTCEVIVCTAFSSTHYENVVNVPKRPQQIFSTNISDSRIRSLDAFNAQH